MALPSGAAIRPAPIVVMAHGLSGTRRDRLGAFAERFAAAGFAALVFDHRGFGDSGGEPDLFDPGAQLEDWRAAIAFARSLPEVDPSRVATFGSSMGGGNALAAAAEDPRRRRRDQPGSLPRHRPPGASLLAAGDGPDARCRGPGPPSPGRRPAGRAGPDQRARWGGGLAARGLDRRGLTLAQPRLLALAARPPLPARRATPPSCTAPGSSASARPTASPSRARRSPPPAARQRASYGPTPASTTSTSTTAPCTRRWSPTSSTSCAGTSSKRRSLHESVSTREIHGLRRTRLMGRNFRVVGGGFTVQVKLSPLSVPVIMIGKGN